MRKLLSIACLGVGLAATACAPPQGSTLTTTGPATAPQVANDVVATPTVAEAHRASNVDLEYRFHSMVSRFPPSALGTPDERAAAARELHEQHLNFRRSVGLPDYPSQFRDAQIRDLSDEPVAIVTRQVEADFRSRLAEMRVRVPPTSVGTPAQYAAVAGDLYNQHEQYRRSLGLPSNPPAERERLISLLLSVPREQARAQAQHDAFAIRQEVSRFDGRQVSVADLSRLASRYVTATQPDLSREQRGAAVAAAEGEFRRELESRRSAYAARSAQRREADLTRLAMTGLADMPREITLAAGENLADARSPFDTRSNWRPDPAALRQEEVRLRNAIASRMEGERRQADQNARASADAAASRQQADLQRAIEMARADAERERRERQSLRMIELGLGLAAGANRPPPPPSNDGTRTYNINGRIFNCTTSGTFTNCR